jgi:hypothetical protein
MSNSSFYICPVKKPEGYIYYLTLFSPDSFSAKGSIPPEAIIGILQHPLEPNESITPDNFSRNKIFVEFMHKVIAKYAPHEAGCKEEAKRQGKGTVCILDGRTKNLQGEVPIQDIIGGFSVDNGEIVTDSYQANAKHMILSGNGFFRLSPELNKQLRNEIQALIGTDNCCAPDNHPLQLPDATRVRSSKSVLNKIFRFLGLHRSPRSRRKLDN